jgi:hypothetical protein
MASSFPSSLDAFTNPSSSDALDSVSVPHAGQHSDLNDAVEALEAKVGADSSAVATSLDYKVAQLEAGVTGGKILQVVSTTKTDTFSASVAGNGNSTSVTGLTATITPTSTSNKVLVMATITGANSINYAATIAILTRGGTPIGVGDTAGNRTSVTGGTQARLTNDNDVAQTTVLYLDSPSSTSALTYGIEIANFNASTATLYVNRATDDVDSANRPRSSSTITVMEVSA